MDQAAFLEIQRRMAEEDARRGTHPTAQAPVGNAMGLLGDINQLNMRPLAALGSRIRGDQGTLSHIMGGGRYEPGMITGSELADIPVSILGDMTNLIPGMGLPTPAELGALALVVPRVGSAAAKRLTQVLAGPARNTDDLVRGLVSAGINPHIAQLPGVLRMYNRALNMSDDGVDLIRHIDGLSPQRYTQASATSAAEYTKLYDDFTTKFKAPSFFDVDEAIRGQVIARRRLAQATLESQGVAPAQAARQALSMAVKDLPVSHWYDNMIRGLQTAVQQGVEPTAARAVFDSFNLLSASMSPKSSVKSQVTKALNVWDNLMRGIPVESAVTGHTQTVLSPIKRFFGIGDILDTQKAGSFHWGMSGDRQLFTFDSMELRRMFHQYLGDAAGVDVRSPEFLTQMAEHFKLVDRPVIVNKVEHIISPESIASGAVGFEQLSDMLYGSIASSSRYSLFTGPQIAAAAQQPTIAKKNLQYPTPRGQTGIFPTQAQGTTWVGWAPETGVASGDEIFDVLDRALAARNMTWADLMTGKTTVRSVAGPAVAMQMAAMIFFEEMENDLRGAMPNEDGMNEAEGRQPFFPDGLTPEELNARALEVLDAQP